MSKAEPPLMTFNLDKREEEMRWASAKQEMSELAGG